MSIDMEATGHTKFESFVKDMDVRKTEGSPDRVFTVYKNQSLCSENKVTLSSEISTASDVNVEFNKVSSEDELFVHISDWHEFSIQRTIKSEEINQNGVFGSLNSHSISNLHSWSRLHHRLLHHGLLHWHRLSIHEEDSLFLAGTKSVASLNKHRLSHLSHHGTEFNSLL